MISDFAKMDRMSQLHVAFQVSTSGVGEILRSFAICYKNGESGHDSGELEKWGGGGGGGGATSCFYV